jgi:long-chain acyl-CoA synthetase
MPTASETFKRDSSPAPTARPATGPRGDTAVDLFTRRVRESGDRVALRSKVGGAWRTSSWRDCDRKSRDIAAGLIDLGLGEGDRVVILADTREEWLLADVGVLRAGAVTVPIYPSNLPDQCEYIINDCGAVVIIVDGPHQLEKLLAPEVRPKLTRVKKVVYMSDHSDLERRDAKGRNHVSLADVLPDKHPDRSFLIPLAEVQKRGATWIKDHPNRLSEIENGLDPDQAATIVYTSGTTGPPKGVVLPHSALVFECRALQKTFPLSSADEQLLFLPLAHIFAKLLAWSAVAVGTVTSFAESVPKLISNLSEVRPTYMGAVPRVYEKAYTKIQSSFDEKRKAGGLGKLVVEWALKKGKQRSDAERAGKQAEGLGIKIADRLVFQKVRDTFGGRMRFFISGGAPLAREIAEFFHAAGLLVLEGYGLTETTAATNLNLPTNYRFGTVGPALPGVEVKIATDGEVLMRGANIMKEYFGKPDATAEAIDSEGWFHSGDIGVIDPDGHLRITDRKKDIIVTAGGKNVAPQNIENGFKALCPLASQMMVYGDKRKFLSALITLNHESLEAWARGRSLAFTDYADLTQKVEVRAAVQEYVDKLNSSLASYETIKKFAILARDFDQESGELTPTLKVKRKFCTEKYKEILEGFYAGGREQASA